MLSYFFTQLPRYASQTMTELQEEALTISECIEDTVEHICDEYRLSGEKVWVMISALSHYHLSQFPQED